MSWAGRTCSTASPAPSADGASTPAPPGRPVNPATTTTEGERAQNACPAWATGKPLNPKTLIMALREMAVEAEKGVGLLPAIPFLRASDAPGQPAGAPG